MPGGDLDTLLGKEPGDLLALVSLWCEGEDFDHSVARFHELRRVGYVRGLDLIGEVGSAVTGVFVNERAFDVQTRDDSLDQRVGVGNFDNLPQSAAHAIDIIGNNSGKNRLYAVGIEQFACGVKLISVDAFAVEINTTVTIKLQINK